ncbi:MAG: MoxR family ATPase [Candidatus Sumerlaeia bacterium]|nr:MoxR family ATPase [Candidatus Sumerlaeia bacterium]
MPDKAVVENVELILSHPDELQARWIGSPLIRDQLVAAWLVINPDDLPLNPRLIGKPGIGKTTLAYAVAREMGKDVYIFQCTMDTRPEDLIVTPVVASNGRIAYHASPLTTAMIRGGVCILDEANRMSEKAWASLAPLLDYRRYVESIIAGIKIHAHPDFRVCCTMNEDASTYEVPEYIQSRLQPTIEVPFPDKNQEKNILKFNVPFAPEQLLQLTVAFLQRAHRADMPYTPRDGIHILRYALKMSQLREGPPEAYLEEGIEGVLGIEGLDFFHGRASAPPPAEGPNTSDAGPDDDYDIEDGNHPRWT